MLLLEEECKLVRALSALAFDFFSGLQKFYSINTQIPGNAPWIRINCMKVASFF